MANYQELLSRAVNALPDNNGASRREVYEKARKALVTQLRAISPPLPAREITRHRLELEDCIRQVEYDATETLLGALKGLDEEAITMELEPEPEQELAPEPETEPEPEPEVIPEPASETETEKSRGQAQLSGIDAIVARAEKAQKDAASSAPVSPIPDSAPISHSDDMKDEPAAIKETREAELSEQASVSGVERQLESSMVSSSRRSEEPLSPAHRMASVSGTAIGEAMSRVREVELDAASRQHSIKDQSHEDVSAQSGHVEPSPPKTGKSVGNGHDGQQEVAQKVVDRAIEVLESEARGEHVPMDEIGLNGDGYENENATLLPGEAGFTAGGDEEKGGNALTIFLILAIVLLGAVGGGGYWAWREGYVDLDALFSASSPASPGKLTSGTNVPADQQGKLLESDSSGPGNTATDTNADTPTQELVSANNGAGKGDARLPSANGNTTTTTNQSGASPGNAGASANVTTPDNTATPATLATTPGPTDATGANKSEARLTTNLVANEPTLATGGAKNNADTVATGTQSLLLEASADGTTGAVPFSGTVKWSRGLDELGQPTLIGTANIPARNLGVKVLIRRNADPSLPASHLMEIDFTVPPTFVGGAVAGLPGILLKNEELVQGKALIGASARVVGNSFLFALSAAPQDVRTNINLLKTRKWMDLAIIYANGRRAIITLEKDAAAQKMFDEVLATWQKESDAEAAKAGATSGKTSG